jgi:hypothetical protein
MGRLGKVRTFQISRPLLTWASLFFAAFVIFSIIAINGYLRLKEEHHTLLDKMELLEVEVEKGGKAFQKSQKHISFLEEYIRLAEERTGSVPQAGSPSLQGKRPDVTGKTASSAKSPGEWIQVKDMLLEKEGAKLSVSFRLANTQPGDHPMTGYVHIIAENDKSDPPRFWIYPQQKLVKGLPENFRSGHAFSITRHKLIQGKIQIGSDSPHPLAVKVLIYDQAGTLIQERAFEVPQESRYIRDPKAFVPHSGSTLNTSFHGSDFFTFTWII